MHQYRFISCKKENKKVDGEAFLVLQVFRTELTFWFLTLLYRKGCISVKHAQIAPPQPHICPITETHVSLSTIIVCLPRLLTCALTEMRFHQQPRWARDSFHDETYPNMSRSSHLLNVTQKKKFQFLMGLPRQEHKLFVLVGSVWK